MRMIRASIDLELAKHLTTQRVLREQFQQSLVQRLNPQLHHWNHNTVFSIERMREDFGFTPDYTFATAVEQTYEWFRREGLDKVRTYDFGWEDQLIQRIGG